MSAFFGVATVIIVLGWTASVATVLWRARTSPREGGIAIASGIALAAWAITALTLARDGVYQGAPVGPVPPVGINLVVSLLVYGLALWASPSLRGLVSRQSSIIALQTWRVAGLLLLMHTVVGDVPALFGVTAGAGDVLVGLTAFGVARTADIPQGRRRALIWNGLGVLDLVVAVTLGVTTSPGPTQLFHTVPTSALLTVYPLAMIPVFAVPLALTLHGISLWQLLRGSWAERSSSEVSRGRPTYQPAQASVVAGGTTSGGR
jgi:hypothetical protein